MRHQSSSYQSTAGIGRARRGWTASAVTLLATVGLLGFGFTGSTSASAATSPAAKAPKVLYYVAMGDSLGAGQDSSSPATNYVSDLYRHELTRYPNLQMVNLSCGGATTSTLIHGQAPPGCPFTTGTQLGDTEAFLRAHPKQVAMLTIDIGANNVDACAIGAPLTDPCIASGVAALNADIPTIVTALRSVYPKLAIYGMGYYDPFLDNWLNGTAGQALAQESVPSSQAFNALLGQLYSANGVAFDDPTALFQTTDFDLTGTYNGATEPQNVANICNWTNACRGDAHANDTGYAVLAQSFEPVIDHLSVDPTALPAATVKTRYAGALAAIGGHPKYTWRLAPGSAPLPPGLRLRTDGAFSGKPLQSGTYPFSVVVTDSKLAIHSPPAVNTAQGTLSITVS
jgi:lysophospholipase L1-like esterase